MNSLIPMADKAGNRCVVNQWDVDRRKADGWTVIGNPDHWTSTTKAPGHGPDPEIDLAPGKPAPVIDVAAERTRIMAILRAAAPAQGALAEQLIADGKPADEAVKVLAADAEARRKPADKAKASQAEPVAKTAS